MPIFYYWRVAELAYFRSMISIRILLLCLFCSISAIAKDKVGGQGQASAPEPGKYNFQTNSHGLKYVLYPAKTRVNFPLYPTGNGEKMYLGNVVFYSYKLRTLNDALIASGRRGADMDVANYPGDCYELLTMMAKGDSAVFEVAVDSFYAAWETCPVPRGTLVHIMMHVDDLITPEFAENAAAYRNKIEDTRKKAAKEEAKKMEMPLLEKYLHDSCPNAIKTKSGLYYVVQRQGDGPKPKKGDLIYFHFDAYYIDGTPFANDERLYSATRLRKNENEDGSIKGLEEGLSLFGAGTKVRFIIPSSLAFQDGWAFKEIPPYATLIYNVEIIK